MDVCVPRSFLLWWIDPCCTCFLIRFIERKKERATINLVGRREETAESCVRGACVFVSMCCATVGRGGRAAAKKKERRKQKIAHTRFFRFVLQITCCLLALVELLDCSHSPLSAIIKERKRKKHRPPSLPPSHPGASTSS